MGFERFCVDINFAVLEKPLEIAKHHFIYSWAYFSQKTLIYEILENNPHANISKFTVVLNENRLI